MSYSFRMTPERDSELVLEGEPGYCRLLPFAPSAREPELKQGTWLILMYATWSGPDRRAVPVAISVAKEWGGKVQLGIRPFSEHDEIRKWCPQVKEQWGSPVWLLLRDGEFLGESMGVRTEHELTDWMRQVLASKA